MQNRSRNTQSTPNIKTSSILDKTHVSKLDKLLEFGELPEVKREGDLFTFRPITKFLRGETAAVAYEFPFVQTNKFALYAIISVPTTDAHAIILDNGEFVKRVVINHDNTTFFDPKNAEELGQGMYSQTPERPLDNCLKSVINTPGHDGFVNCTTTAIDAEFTRAYELKPDLAVIFRAAKAKVTVNCIKHIEELVDRVNLINYPGCSIRGRNFNIGAPFRAAEVLSESQEVHIGNLTHPTIRIKPRPPADPKLIELRVALKKELEEYDTPGWTENFRQYWPIGMGIFFLAAALLTDANSSRTYELSGSTRCIHRRSANMHDWHKKNSPAINISFKFNT